MAENRLNDTPTYYYARIILCIICERLLQAECVQVTRFACKEITLCNNDIVIVRDIIRVSEGRKMKNVFHIIHIVSIIILQCILWHVLAVVSKK